MVTVLISGAVVMMVHHRNISNLLVWQTGLHWNFALKRIYCWRWGQVEEVSC